MITLTLTPAEHAFLLLKLGRGTGSTIRPGESLSAEEVLRLTEKLEGSAGFNLMDANYSNGIVFPVWVLSEDGKCWRHSSGKTVPAATT